jgi:secondary thiamine-phosphate synthase enzyme
MNLFLQHTSASLTLNENADPTVQSDMESAISKLIKENEQYYQHTCEGPDDMPAHIKSTIIGNSLTIPITDGKLALGTWQGIYLFEHRDMCPTRNIVLTIYA